MFRAMENTPGQKGKRDDGTRLIRVTDQTHLSIRLLAARLDMTFGEVVRVAVEEKLARESGTEGQ